MYQKVCIPHIPRFSLPVNHEHIFDQVEDEHIYVFKHVWRISLRIITVAHGEQCMSTSKDQRKMVFYTAYPAEGQEKHISSLSVCYRTNFRINCFSRKKCKKVTADLTSVCFPVLRIHTAKARCLMI